MNRRSPRIFSESQKGKILRAWNGNDPVWKIAISFRTTSAAIQWMASREGWAPRRNTRRGAAVLNATLATLAFTGAA